MKISVIGLGLIGGSFALEMKRLRNDVFGIDINTEHAEKALELNLIDQIAHLDEGISDVDLIVLAMPVKAVKNLLPKILDRVNDNQMVIDLGSTKTSISEAVKEHPKRAQYLACHPMAGTEFSGPKAAVPNLFRDRIMVICEKERTDQKVVQSLEQLFLSMGMELVYYGPEAHDKHAAYVSHISHITSFALANTVLEKEENEADIFSLAAGGFTSTVRLAKSNPETWTEIFSENRHEVLDVLKEHMRQLRKFESALEANDETELKEIILEANKIKKIV